MVFISALSSIAHFGTSVLNGGDPVDPLTTEFSETVTGCEHPDHGTTPTSEDRINREIFNHSVSAAAISDFPEHSLIALPETHAISKPILVPNQSNILQFRTHIGIIRQEHLCPLKVHGPLINHSLSNKCFAQV